MLTIPSFPTQFASDVQSGFSLCATKHIVAGSRVLSQFYCDTAATTTTLTIPETKLADPSAGIQAIALSDLLPHNKEFEESLDRPWWYILVIALASTVLILLLVVAARLFMQQHKIKKHAKIRSRSSILASDSWTVLAELEYEEPPLTPFQRLGWYGMLAIFLPLPIQITSIGLLATLWASAADPSSDSIRNWVTQGKLPQMVAILSFIIRTASAPQTATAVSMISSIGLEAFCFRLLDIPVLLLGRSGNASHWDISCTFWNRCRDPFMKRSFTLLLVLGQVSLVALSLQFTSTLLLSDLAIESARIPDSNCSVPVGFTKGRWSERGGGSKDSNYAASPPLAYYPYAEIQLGPPLVDVIDYTNATRRAFAPIGSQGERRSLRTYTGYATTLDVTSVCIPPILDKFTLSGSSSVLSLKAHVIKDDLEDKLNPVSTDTGGFLNSFMGRPNVWDPVIECSFPLDLLNTSIPGMEWITYMCSLGKGAFAFVNLSYPEVSATLRQDYSTEWWKVTDISQLEEGQHGSWATFSYRDSPFTWAISICSTKLQPAYHNLTFDSDKPLRDRNLTFDEALKDVDTKDLLNGLGASARPLSIADRGLFSPKSDTDWNDTLESQMNSDSPYAIQAPLDGNIMGPFHREWVTTYQLCTWCRPTFQANLSYLHPVYTAIIQQSLQSTGRPVLALQAFWTLVYQSYYYDSLQFFDIMADAKCGTWATVSLPVKWTGFVVTACMLTLHLVLVFSVYFYFNKHTKFSKINDPWLTFTQALRGELIKLLDEMIQKGEVDPKVAIEELGKQSEVVGLDVDIFRRAAGIRKRHWRNPEDEHSDEG